MGLTSVLNEVMEETGFARACLSYNNELEQEVWGAKEREEEWA